MEDEVLDLIADEDEVSFGDFYELTLKATKICNKTINKCTFNKCDLHDLEFNNVFFERVNFAKCDLSNTKFENCNFREVEFIEDKLLGVHIIDSYMTHVLIKNSLCRYINIIEVKNKDLKIIASDLTECSFYDVRLNKVKFADVNFRNSEFFATSLRGIDFSSCDIIGLRCSLDCLKGIKVNSMQALELVNLLDIEIVN